jgi:anaerobic selenocysteine-containing dehydrogenase/Fe-S-cluster-containing dehydrogenase component
MDRRRFLTMIGMAGTAAVGGCARARDEPLIPYLIPIEEVTPGVSVEYATVCRECPAGCGMVARVRDGRAYKVDGNPEHPISRGVLCPRGQTALQNLYNPDRIPAPLARDRFGRLQPIPWEEAERLLLEALRAARSGRAAWLGHLETGALDTLVDEWLQAVLPGAVRLRYEPFAYEALRAANERVFGQAIVPDLRIDAARMLLSFGAEFLETWVSNLEYSRQFGAWRDRRRGADHGGRYVFIGPRLSLTGANADEWLPVRPGTEMLVARAMLALLSEPGAAGTAPRGRGDVGALADAAGIAAESVERLAREFASASPSLALPLGTLAETADAVAANEAILRLNEIAGNVGRTYFPDRAHALSGTVGAAEVGALLGAMRGGEIGALFLHHANPVYHLPEAMEVSEALARVPRIISFSSYLDETTRLASLVLPDHSPYESWGSYTPRPHVTGLLQPLVMPVHSTRQTGDLLLASAAALGAPLGATDFQAYLRRTLGLDDDAWSAALNRGGVYTAPAAGTGSGRPAGAAPGSRLPAPREDGASPLRAGAADVPAGSLRAGEAESREPRAESQELLLTLQPSLRFFDGRTANRPLTHEIPDAMAKVVWGSWAEIHPTTAESLGVTQDGDLLALASDHGRLEVPALVTARVHPQTIAIEIGLGHTAYTRYAEGVGVNPLRLLGAGWAGPGADESAAAPGRWSLPVTVSRLPARRRLIQLQASYDPVGQPIAREIPLAAARQLTAAGAEPGPEGPEAPGAATRAPGSGPSATFYRFIPPGEQQWGMVIDLDRCIGCNACVAACYTENNVPTVGPAECARGREMSWLRIENYAPPPEAVRQPASGLGAASPQPGAAAEARVVFLPMLCQQCDNAPCEYVCPVYATTHSQDGLNQQIYSRCVGTRYCSHNCPYKVRRFNWTTYEFPPPLDQALNPDVIHRSKGVMEKCTFCIQRIRGGRIEARAQRRPIRDGEIRTACMEACPTEAIIFGDLKNEESRVRAVGADPRGYGVLAGLNTYPNITYLARVRA